MTASVDIHGTKRPVSLRPTDALENTLFTARKELPSIVEIWISNEDSSARDATVKYGNGTTDYMLIPTKSIPAKDFIREDCLIPLREGWTIKVTASVADKVTFTVIIVEHSGRVQG